MPQRVYANVVDHKIVDNGVEIEDVTSVALPDIELTKNEFDVAGLAGKLTFGNPAHLENMTYSIVHNNGRNCELLTTPDIHEQEFRVARIHLKIDDNQTDYDSVKYRVAGQPTKLGQGSIERGNPMGTTVEYTCTRFIMEVAGKVVIHIDIPAKIVIYNGVNYTNKVDSILNS